MGEDLSRVPCKRQNENLPISQGLLAEPGFVSELKGVTVKFGTREGGEEDAEFLQSLLVKFKSRGKLPENCSHFSFNARHGRRKRQRFLQSFNRLMWVMNRLPFTAKTNFSAFVVPALKNFFPGKAVKRDVQLDGVKCSA